MFNSFIRYIYSGIFIARNKRHLVSALFGVTVLSPNILLAENVSLPAVSDINGKLSLQGALKDGKEVGIASGALSIPLAHNFGLQLDGAVNASGKIGGAGAHLFWRDPSQGLFGVYADQMWAGSAEVSRIGLEAELYHGDFSLEGLIGYEDAKTNSDVFSRFALAYYPLENLRLSVEHRYSNWQDGNWSATGHSGALNAEYQLDAGNDQNLSLYGEARFGEDRFDAFSVGLKIYFGEPKSLIRRHREDDPKTHLDTLGPQEDSEGDGGCVPTIFNFFCGGPPVQVL